MPIKCQSNQVNTEHYHYTMLADENIYFPVKARPGEVIVVHSVCLYNPSQVNYTHAYKLMRQRGHIIRLNYAAAINAGVVQRWATDVYIKEHEEVGFAITPNGAGDEIAANFQIIRMKDSEYFMPT